ncbi:hypothetical protein NVP1104O_40 [Vibrio phage 1.104.O._10N.286.49.A12]|nr:hypothetical protein NVP1104O_40 [Vibrio phage 1.104.O._10N.286.49.A12]
MKINKQIKTHIADMAIRKKYKAEFTRLLKAVTDTAYDELYAKYHNEDYDVLPQRALSAVEKTKEIDVPALIMDLEKPRFGSERGYGLNVAFDTRRRIDSLSMEKAVYGTRYKFHNSFELYEKEFKALTTFLKEASQARQTLLDAMAHYKSCKKMFAELPWTETYYPEVEKKPVVNIVPVSTIAAANELMEL